MSFNKYFSVLVLDHLDDKVKNVSELELQAPVILFTR